MAANQESVVWRILYQQQGLEFAATAELKVRRLISRFFDELAEGFRNTTTAQIAEQIDDNRKLRKGYVIDDATGSNVAVVLWTTDFAFLPEVQAYEEVVQVWAVCAPNGQDEDAFLGRLRSLWKEKSRRSFGALIRAVKQPRPIEHLETGRWREWPRQVPALEDFDVAWLSKFVQFPQELRYRWAEGQDIFWSRLPLVGTEEQQRHVLAPGPLVLVGRAGSGKTLVLRDRLWHHYYAGRVLGRQQRQIFVTLSPALARSAAEHFAEAQQQYFPGSHSIVYEDSLDLASPPDELLTLPLFVSLRTFLKLLASWLHCDFFQSKLVEADFEGTAPSAPVAGQKVEITFLSFREYFWPKVQVKGLDALLVWSEVQSFLKGHPMAQNNRYGFALDRNQYMNDVSKRQAIGLAEHRDIIFDIFESYQKWCHKHNCFDRMDVAQNLAAALQSLDAPDFPLIDWLYIDEVQDFSLVELDICMRCLRDLSGAAFGGDTTQTVSQGISFRFCDLDSALRKEALRRNVPIPPAKQWAELTINHRSHAGIVALSNILVQCLDTLFPWTVDRLAPARSSIAGPKPFIIDAEKVASLQLGAEQVVLVGSRDTQLPVGWHGVVATPSQVKGLEYTDVVLLDWWESTQNALLWDALLAIQDELQKAWEVVDDEDHQNFSQKWQTTKFMPLSKEIKQLFVAITRAQHCFLICNQRHSPLAKRVCDFFQTLNVLTPMSNGSSAFVEMQNRAMQQQAASDFEKRGEAYFMRGEHELASQAYARAAEIHIAKRDLELAQHAFEQAMRDPARNLSEAWRNQLDRKRRRCNAHVFMRDARRTKSGGSQTLWQKAAEELYDLEEFIVDRGLCLEEAAQLEQSSRIRENLWHQAGECYFRAQDFGRAAPAFENALSFKRAEGLFAQLELWERAASCSMHARTGDSCTRSTLSEYFVKAAQKDGAVPNWVSAIVKDKKWWNEGAKAAHACQDWESEAKYLENSKSFPAAGEAYERAKMFKLAGQCFEKVEKAMQDAEQWWKRGAELFEKLEESDRAVSLWKRLAKKCEETRQFELAAESREKAGQFDQAAALFRKGGDEDGVRRAWSKAAIEHEKKKEWKSAAEKWDFAKERDKAAHARTKADEAQKEEEAKRAKSSGKGKGKGIGKDVAMKPAGNAQSSETRNRPKRKPNAKKASKKR